MWTSTGCRLAAAGALLNVKTTARNGKVSAILLVDDSSELMVISQYGKIIRIDTKTIRAAGLFDPGCQVCSISRTRTRWPQRLSFPRKTRDWNE